MTPVPVIMLIYTIESAKKYKHHVFPTGRPYITMAESCWMRLAQYTLFGKRKVLVEMRILLDNVDGLL